MFGRFRVLQKHELIRNHEDCKNQVIVKKLLRKPYYNTGKQFYEKVAITYTNDSTKYLD